MSFIKDTATKSLLEDMRATGECSRISGGALGKLEVSLLIFIDGRGHQQEPTSLVVPAAGTLQPRRARSTRYFGGTNSFGASDPVPKKNFSISASRNFRAFGSTGVRRYSLMSIVWCPTHFCQAAFETFS